MGVGKTGGYYLVEIGCDRPRVGCARGFDDEVVEVLLPLQHIAFDTEYRASKVIFYAAADAAVGELLSRDAKPR
eukprot:1510115-Rhodomonas_salina.1